MSGSILSICPDKLSRNERHALLTAGGYQVVSVGSIAEAFYLLELRTFAAVLLDSHFAEDAANLLRLRCKCRVLSLQFPIDPALLLHALNALLLSRQGANRRATSRSAGL